MCFVLLAGCKNQAPPAAETTATAPAAEAPAAASAPGPAAEASAPSAPSEAAGNKFAEESYDLVMQPKGSYASGQAGEAEIVLTAKPPFHMSPTYPYKFKVKESAGLKFANLVVDKDLVKLEHTRAVVPVAFTPEGAGKHTVTGKIFFGICKEDQCQPVNHELALDIDVK